MPAPKVTRNSPMHMVFVLDNSSSMGQSGANEELKHSISTTVEELEGWTKGEKRYFNISVITFAQDAKVHVDYQDSNTLVDYDFDFLDGAGGVTHVHKGLELAYDVLEQDGGTEEHYTPLVVILSDGLFNSTDEQVRESAERIKNMNHPAGEPIFICFALGTDKVEDLLKEISSDGNTYARIESAEDLAEILPEIGTASQVEGGEEEIKSNIRQLEEDRKIENFEDID